ncbi:polysaccharide biosynthesis C-terminal domain-containing protein [Vibrio vulnificus]|uniref:polysaccharide biosynthesis C-terminal domain-containing protein n=3 Tax=Vibrio vulnificus TaxID=672 RepID=UPI00148308A4|nr:polysaccharide biosynthesis C-terminal domain-containing protein [Vibrio vulnificus]EGR8991322.1 hypothetical protein [Vibrio vulnificus]EHU4977150.1 polysaccharide biosynthesis C-terminal domain-containing protein [Vibrio vulnificus]ELO5513291.1 polysaccharide biosynthesis C-terminal domain-containing protein [Vibrio vulnificus]MCA0784990.1 polysaccharide biosynthesis C-terminal domain-containing protein [Vibrio vulnificus]MCU8565083.1 polysaccharide biosynthesis C-terminal domain-containi
MSIFSVNIFSVIKSYLLINNSKEKYSFFVITINLFQYSYLFYAINSNDFTISDIIFGNVILFIFILLYKARSLIRFPPSPSAQLGLNHKIIKFMGMSFAISLSTIIYNNTDKIMIEHLLGESRSLALYQVSYQIFAFPIESMYALISIFTPAFLYRAFDKDVNLYEFNLKVTFKIVLFIIFLLSQLLFLNKIYLKDLLLDSNYIVEDSLPMIFLVSQSVFLLYLISTNIFIVYDKRSYIIGSLTLSSLINILLNWYLIPKFGYVGAAIATLASYSVLTAIVFIIAFNVFKFRFFDWKDCCLALSVPMTYGILGDNYIIYLISIVAISLFYFLTNIKNTYINFLRGV